MFESLEGILISYGYVGLFLASFLASTILPFGSEGLLVLLIYKKFNIPALVLVASVGNFLGACTSYYIGLKGRGFVEKYLRFDPKDIEKAEKIFLKYGPFALLFTWLPFIGDAITVASGILRFKFWIFSILVFTGKFIRYVIIAYSAAVVLT
jgi:membrane protein YqaA with SNARE-associated domain